MFSDIYDDETNVIQGNPKCNICYHKNVCAYKDYIERKARSIRVTQDKSELRFIIEASCMHFVPYKGSDNNEAN